MSDQPWLGVISRISTQEPFDLDASVFSPAPPPLTSDAATGSDSLQDSQIPPSALLWKRHENGQSYIGIRVNQLLADSTQAAFRLAAAALERQVTPIILTTLPDSGFERYGFRVERIIGGTQAERQRLEAELSQFWDLAIIIDVTDVTSLG